MRIGIVKSIDVCKDSGYFILHIGIKKHDLGIQVHEWGIRLMIIKWHICIHF